MFTSLISLYFMRSKGDYREVVRCADDAEERSLHLSGMTREIRAYFNVFAGLEIVGLVLMAMGGLLRLSPEIAPGTCVGLFAAGLAVFAPVVMLWWRYEKRAELYRRADTLMIGRIIAARPMKG